VQRCKIRETSLYTWERALTVLIPWSRVSLQKVTLFQLVKKISRILWQRTVYYHVQRISHSSLTRDRSIQFALSYPISPRPIFLLSTHLRGIVTSGFPTKNPTFIFPSLLCFPNDPLQLLLYLMSRIIFVEYERFIVWCPKILTTPK
jgi:hypothetical protein